MTTLLRRSSKLTIPLAIATGFYLVGGAVGTTAGTSSFAAPLAGFHQDVNAVALSVAGGIALPTVNVRNASPRTRDVFFGGADRQIKAVIARVGS